MAADAAPARPHRNGTQIWPRLVDTGAYWAAIASVYIAYGFLWCYGFKEKRFDEDGKMPAGLAKAYDGTLIDSFPGLNLARRTGSARVPGSRREPRHGRVPAAAAQANPA